MGCDLIGFGYGQIAESKVMEGSQWRRSFMDIGIDLGKTLREDERGYTRLCGFSLLDFWKDRGTDLAFADV